MNAAIAGIGCTAYSKDSGVSVASLAIEACLAASADAGVALDDVDGVVTFAMGDSVRPQTVISGLGLPDVGAIIDLYGGGQACMAAIGHAQLLIESGRARNVLVYRALNGRSGQRLGGADMDDRFAHAAGDSQFTYPVGWIAYPQYVAMAARRHMLRYGTTHEAFAEIAMTFRENAQGNERAVMRKPMSRDDYFDARMIVEPFRLFDICIETDGACAFLITSVDDARSSPHPVVRILAAEQASISHPGIADAPLAAPDLAELYGPALARRLFGRAGVEQDDIDVASIYDCFTFSVISQLEGLGFCGVGEGDAFVRDGNLRRDGRLPTNTQGGMLSEAYVHGFNGLFEVVRQLRGDGGDDQIEGAEVGIATGFGTTMGCAAIVARD